MEKCRFKWIASKSQENERCTLYKLNQYLLETIYINYNSGNLFYHFNLVKDDTLVRSGTCSYLGCFYLWRGILFVIMYIYEKERYRDFTNIMIYYVKPYQYRIDNNICKLMHAKAKLIKLVKTI